MTRGQLRRCRRVCLRGAVALGVILSIYMIVIAVRGKQGQQTGAEQQTKQEETGGDRKLKKSTQTEGQQGGTEETEPNRYAIFDTIPADRGGEEGFVYYEIPESYQRTGGYFPEKIQKYTYLLCQQEGVSYPLIVAMIEWESGYKSDSIGDEGRSFGYMQIMEIYNSERMEELNCNDLMNPYQNVRVGVSLMKELIEKYGTIQEALAAYNYGESGARRNLWSKGIYNYDYNEGIMNRMREIEEELKSEHEIRDEE